MRKVIIILIALITLVGFKCCFGNLYCKKAAVINVSDTVEIIDEDGYVWEFCGNGFNAGDSITIVFNNVGTAEVVDDEIIYAR